MIRPGHSDELQSLRGLAAFAVLLCHSLRSINGANASRFISDVVLNAHAAVVLFFVLSGYVLALSLERRGFSLVAIMQFYVRRAFRIMPALYAGMAVGMIYLLYFRQLPAPQMFVPMTEYYNPAEMRAENTIMSLMGLDAYLLPTSWTITVEIVASVLLPGLVLFATRARGAYPLLVIVLAGVSLVASTALRVVPLYFVDFAIGVFLATSPWLKRIHVSAPAAVLALLVLGYCRLPIAKDYHDAAPGLVEALAAAVLIAAIVQSRAAWLRNERLITLGDWSYSIYLLHLPIVLLVTRLVSQTYLPAASPDLASLAITAFTIVIVFPLAGIVHRYIELPGIGLGNKVARAMQAKIAAPPPIS